MHLTQKARLRHELSPKFLSTLPPKPTRKAPPDVQLCHRLPFTPRWASQRLCHSTQNEVWAGFIYNTLAIELEKDPCHTQAVKRCVSLVSDAPGAMCGQKQQHGFIGTRISSRQSMPNFEMKTQYCLQIKNDLLCFYFIDCRYLE